MSKKKEPIADDESALMERSKKALSDVLGRQPTKQEVYRVHASFKRMAVLMYEHINKSEGENKKNRT